MDAAAAAAAAAEVRSGLSAARPFKFNHFSVPNPLHCTKPDARLLIIDTDIVFYIWGHFSLLRVSRVNFCVTLHATKPETHKRPTGKRRT